MHRPLGCAVVVLLIGLAGCQSGSVGVVTYKPGMAPILQSAAADGEYMLYDDSLVNISSDPKMTYHLHQGEPLGFKTGKTGEIVVVANNNEISMPDAPYIWRQRVDQSAAPSPAPAISVLPPNSATAPPNPAPATPVPVPSPAPAAPAPVPAAPVPNPALPPDARPVRE